MKNANKLRNKLLAVSAAFVAVMLLVSVALFWADDAQIDVEGRSVKAAPTYSLEEFDADNDFDPLSKVDTQVEGLPPMDTLSMREFDEAQVPEPATIGILAIGGSAMLMRRRRNRKA